MQKTYRVTIQEKIIIGNRKKAEPVNKVFIVIANSPKAAKKAVFNSGVSYNKIILIEEVL